MVSRIPAEGAGRTRLVDPSELLYVFAHNERIWLQLVGERLPCRLSLSHLEERLTGHGFLRTHRRFLVNLHRVREVVPYFKGQLGLILDDPDRSEVPVSRALSRSVKQHLGL